MKNLSWTTVSEGPWSKRRKHQAIVWNDKLLLLGGFDGDNSLDLNDVWSWDGDNWSLVTEHAGWSGRDGHCAIVLNGSIYVIGGTDDPYYCQSDVWKSDNGGLNWRQLCQMAPWPERWQHAACVHNDYIYISGGWGGSYLNDIWRSPDGMNWERINENCPWRPRMFHSIISFNGAIYIIGGHDGRMQLNDVWGSSDNGFSWVQVCSSAEWDRRQGHVSVTCDGYVYVMGGFGGSNRYNDLWKSNDCAHWTVVSRECSWSPRQGHACAVYRGSLCVLGGFDESGYCNNMFCIPISQLLGTKQTDSFNTMEKSAAPTKILTVTLTCVLDMIAKLKLKRNDREKLIQKLVNIFALVMSSTNYESINQHLHQKSHSSKNFNNIDCANNSKSNEVFDENSKPKPTKKMSFKSYENLIDSKSFPEFSNIDKNNGLASSSSDEDLNSRSSVTHIEKKVRKSKSLSRDGSISRNEQLNLNLNLSDSKDDNNKVETLSALSPRIQQILKASRQGSPLRETIKRPHSGRIPRINSNEDMRMSFWTNLASKTSNNSPLTTNRKSSASMHIPDNKYSIELPNRRSVDIPLDRNILSSIGIVNTRASLQTSRSSYNVMSQSDEVNNEINTIAVEEINNLDHSQFIDISVETNDTKTITKEFNIDDVNFSLSSNSTDSSNHSYEDILNANYLNGSNEPFNNITSAMLREQMEEQQKGLSKIQTQIKILSEKLASISSNSKPTNDVSTGIDLFNQINLLIHERTSLCNQAVKCAKKLVCHVEVIKKMQKRRNYHFNEIIKKLEKYLRQSGIDPETESEQSAMFSCTWEEWQDYVRQGSDALNELNSVTADIEISKLSNLMKKKGELCSKISEWIENVNNNDFNWSDGLENRLAHNTGGSFGGSFDKILTDSDKNSSPLKSDLAIFKESISNERAQTQIQINSYEELLSEYDTVMSLLDITRMNVKSFIDLEINFIEETQQKTQELVNVCLQKGYGLIRGLLIQNRVDIIEISAMKSEVLLWYEKCLKLKNYNKLEKICDDIILENSIREENLIKLEDKRIDIKSMIEKSSLRRNRGGFSPKSRSNSNYSINLRSSSNESASSNSVTVSNEYFDNESLNEQLKNVEQEVRNYRKDFRKFYREVKKFALEYAPELFHSLPDLAIPGSILGDGGFSEKLKLPKRRLDEYENVKPLIDPLIHKSSNSRHVLLQGVYDNDLVVLKGFILTDNEQRKGFEREITILTRLKNDCIICPKAVVEGIGPHETYIEYIYYKGGNLANWLKDFTRKPWELQGIARQLLYGINYLHDHCIVHKDIKPSNVLMHEDGRVVLTDFELSRDVSVVNYDLISTQVRAGTKGFMAPEVESGQPATYASDMYSFGVLIYYMYFPSKFHELIPGFVSIPSNDFELSDLLIKLLDINPSNRPTANNALMHRYFRITYIERLLSEGEVVEQDRKLEAVRSMLYHCRMENKDNVDVLTVRRNDVVADVLRYFRHMTLDKMKCPLRIIFINEPGIDEGGLLNELFSLFFESVFQNNTLFESCDTFKQEQSDHNDNDSIITTSNNDVRNYPTVFLPTTKEDNDILENLKAFGRILVKTLYEGRRIGNRLSPSVFKFITSTSPNMRDLQIFDPQTTKSLQWVLATVGVEDFGLHFESINKPELGVVNDSNKAKFVLLKINNILVESRKKQLNAIKDGFMESMRAISEDASPFLSLLSHTDWRVLLCGEITISPQRIISLLKYSNFPKKSQLPIWLNEIILSSSDDHLRQFLIFVTGSPSLPSSIHNRRQIEINVRCQPQSNSLPIAHTCFYQLDIPDYKSKEILLSKLIFAFQNTNTFEIV